MKNKFYKKVIIFDLDGVLINSKKNMQHSWTSVQKKFGFKNIYFDDYFNKIGRPFYKILEILKISKNKKNIKRTYDYNSIKFLKLIKFYPNVIKILRELKNKKFILCIVTSKDKKRTNMILNNYRDLFTIIQCPQNNLKGKPYPDQIIAVIKNIKAKKNECIYIGDTYIDYLASKRAKIDFLFAEWGYTKKINKYLFTIKKITDLRKKISLG